MRQMAFDNELYEFCRDCAAAAYDDDGNNIPPELAKVLTAHHNENIEIYNYNDIINENNVRVVISQEKHINTTQINVVIRGTYKEQWFGNMNICPPKNIEGGDSYEFYTFDEDDDKTHYNFLIASNGVYQNLIDYIGKYSNNTENVSVVITGHSRGGAVSNLLAKRLTDDYDFKPNVVAYTFATPNVSPYTPTMEYYSNIFNFCKNQDFIPYIPLTNYNWNYWKYGKTYIESSNNNTVYCNKLTDLMVSNQYAPNVEEYYSKKFQNETYGYYISLYNYMCSDLALPMSGGPVKNFFRTKDIMRRTGNNYKGLKKLSSLMSQNLSKILLNHYQVKYSNLEFDDYIIYTYIDALGRCNVGGLDNYLLNQNVLTQSLNNNIQYKNTGYQIRSCLTEFQSILQFLLCEDDDEVSNVDKLGWDIDDTSTWAGITFNNSGNITKIDLPFKDLYGTINLSNFSELEYVDISSNWIDTIYLLNDTALTYLDVGDNELQSCIVSTNTALEYLDCSFNNIGTLNVSNNTLLTELSCSNCGLSTLDLSNLINLETLDCSFNNLNSIDTSYNASLTSLYCVMNYLDLTNSVLINGFDTISIRDNSDVVYEPQYLPHNAVFDIGELNAIQSIGSANADLGMVDNGIFNLEKMQEYFEFEKVNGVYRVSKIYFDNESISGALNCSDFTELKEVYCSDTGITSLNLSACSDTEIINCSNAELCTLILPANTAQSSSEIYDLECEGNHLDINIFSPAIIANIESKENAVIDYRHQLIDAEAEDFDSNDYSTLTNLYNQLNNANILDWDLDEPGYFDEIDWRYDTQSQTYKICACDFSLLKIEGNCDLSNSTDLEDLCFLGTNIATVELPGISIPAYAFYDCKRLEAVTISNNSVSIGNLAFYNNKTLQGVYVPNTVVNIAENAFEDCDNVKLAGEENSYVESYAQTNSIPFETGYFVCGNVVVKQTSSGGHSGHYPVEGASVSEGDNTCETDKYGYYVSFGANNGAHTFDLTYPYGWDLEIDAVISNAPMIVTTAIPMVICDYNTDGYINGRDYAFFKTANVQVGDTDFKYYDINKDGIKNNNDWQAVWGLLGEERPNIQQDLMPRALLRVSPQRQYKNNTERNGIEIIEGIDD